MHFHVCHSERSEESRENSSEIFRLAPLAQDDRGEGTPLFDNNYAQVCFYTFNYIKNDIKCQIISKKYLINEKMI